MATELGVGYISIVPSTNGLGKALHKGFAGVDKIGDKAGKSIGKALKDGVEATAKPDLSEYESAVRRTEAKLADHVKKSSESQEDSLRKVEIARARAADAQKKYAQDSPQFLAAKDKLIIAERNHKRSTDDAAEAQKQLRDELGKAKASYADAQKAAETSAQGTEKSFKGIGARIKAAMSGDFKSAFAGVEGDAAASANDVAGEFTQAGDEAAGGFSSKLVDGLKGVGGLVGVAGIGASLATGIVGGMEREKLGGKLAAQLDLTGPDAERAGDVAGKLYAGAWGESMDETHDAVSAVMSSIPGMMDAPQGALEGVTAKALDLSSAFDVDVNESVGAIGVMMREGLAPDANAAFDLIVGGMQNIPAAFRDELLPAFTEYSGYFGDLGISGETAMGMMIKGAENGTIGVDKMGDAVKEFQIRSTDMSKATGDVYDTLGLDMQDMTNKILAGGDSAQGAMGDIIQGLLEIEDPAARAEAAIGLFGTPLEDLSVNEIPNFLGMLDPAGDKLDNFSGSSEKLGDTLNNNTATAFESLKRGISTGFVDVVGGAASALGGVWEAVQPLMPVLGPLATGIGIAAIAYGAWSAAAWGVTAANWAVIGSVAAWLIPLGLLVGSIIYAYNNIGWFRDLVNTAWAKIKEWTSALVTWWTETAFPAIMDAVGWLGDKFVWLYQNIIKPVWGWIKGAVAGVVDWFTGTVVPAFQGAVDRVGGFFDFLYRNFIAPFVWAFRVAIGAARKWFADTIVPAFRSALEVLGARFRWLNDKVIQPVWTWIRDKIGAFLGWFNTKRLELQDRLRVLGEKFRALYNAYVKPAFDWIRDKASAVWGVLRDRVFTPMRDGLTRLSDAFTKAKDGIGRTWDKLKAKVKEPIAFVVNKVINPFLSGYNTINDAWGGTNIDTIPGFRTGGYTGRRGRDEVAGVVHGDEHVIRSESRRDIERTNPGLLERLNRNGASALPSFGHEGHAAHGGMAAGGPGGPGTYLWGALQNAIYSSGVAHVRGSAPGYNIPAAARAWNNMSNLKVRYGSGPNQINVGGGAPAGTWGYAWTDGRIALNPGIPAGMKTGTAAHEIGHVLGLDHAGTNSIMHPMMRGPLWPSGYDRQTIQRIYGGSGKGNPPEGGGGGFDIFGAIKKVLSGPLGKLKELLSGGNAFSQMAGGLAKNVVNGIMEKASGGRIDDIWDAPVGTTHALRPGVSSIYNGTGGVEHFKRVDPAGGDGGLHVHGDVYTVDENQFANAVFKKIERRRSLAYAA